MARSVHQLKVTLKDALPPIWRRLQVPSEISLAQLHRVLQVAMGWQDSHLHQFKVGPDNYGVPHPDDWKPVRDETKATLQQITPDLGNAFEYKYDFGDSWSIE